MSRPLWEVPAGTGWPWSLSVQVGMLTQGGVLILIISQN